MKRLRTLRARARRPVHAAAAVAAFLAFFAFVGLGSNELGMVAAGATLALIATAPPVHFSDHLTTTVLALAGGAAAVAVFAPRIGALVAVAAAFVLVRRLRAGTPSVAEAAADVRAAWDAGGVRSDGLPPAMDRLAAALDAAGVRAAAADDADAAAEPAAALR